jgi:hypothetical protein
MHMIGSLGAPDPLPAASEIVTEWERYPVRLRLIERPLAWLADAVQSTPLEPVTRLIDVAARASMPIVEAQARRLRGLLTGGPDRELDLALALEAFVACAVPPSVARVQIELGKIRGDQALVAQGIGTLERLGDLEQLERIMVRGG